MCNRVTGDAQSTPATAAQVAVSAPTTPSTVRTIDFNTIWNVRKRHPHLTQVPRLSPLKATNLLQPLQSSSKTSALPQPGPSSEHPSSLKVAIPPLPRHVRRTGAPDTPRSPTAQSAAVSAVSASTVQASAQETAQVAGVSMPSSAHLKPRLPRRDVIRNMHNAQPSASGSSAASSSRVPPSAVFTTSTVSDTEMVIDEVASAPTRHVPHASQISLHTSISSSHSGSPSADGNEEDGHSLIYPSSTPEETPEAEVRTCCILQ